MRKKRKPARRMLALALAVLMTAAMFPVTSARVTADDNVSIRAVVVQEYTVSASVGEGGQAGGRVTLNGQETDALTVDENSDVCDKFGIRNIPTLIFLKNGEVVSRHVGTATKSQLAEMIENNK